MAVDLGGGGKPLWSLSPMSGGREDVSDLLEINGNADREKSIVERRIIRNYFIQAQRHLKKKVVREYFMISNV